MKPIYEAIVIGASAGGIKALQKLLSSLYPDFQLPIIIVQHLHAFSENFIVEYLDEHTDLKIKEAEEKEIIEPGTVYIAPPNYHLLIENDRSFSLSTDEKVNHARPSIDVLFETAADTYDSHLIGVILTGANSDGSHGLNVIHQKGGLTIVQDPHTAAVDSMPKAAIALTRVDYVQPLWEIGPLLNQFDIAKDERKLIIQQD
jgi:two-component system chemotaxis response regulator CheB